MTERQKLFLERNKYRKNIGNCVICKGPSNWNEDKGRYDRFCSDKCKTEYVKVANKRNLDKYGTTNLAALPEFQRNKLMANRSIALTYTFKDGTRKVVLSKIEYGILEKLEEAGYASDDIEAPASFAIPYEFESQKKMHIPDFYIKSANLIISGKDGLDNPNTHPSFLKDRKKNIAIFKTILDNYNYNYVQVEGEKEVKAFKSTLDIVEKLKKSKGRVIVPPRIDYVIYNECDSVSEDIGNFKVVIIRKSFDTPYLGVYFAYDVLDNYWFKRNPNHLSLIALPSEDIIKRDKENGIDLEVAFIDGLKLSERDFNIGIPDIITILKKAGIEIGDDTSFVEDLDLFFDKVYHISIEEIIPKYNYLEENIGDIKNDTDEIEDMINKLGGGDNASE